MTICVVYPAVCAESSKELAKALGGIRWNPYQQDIPRKKISLYFNYGVSDCTLIEHPRMQTPVINLPMAVRIAKNKIQSYYAFKRAGVATCEFVTREQDVPNSWKWVVCRDEVEGRNCDGVLICPRDDLVHNCPLYTKFFPNDEEHRIVVFKGKVVARYMKGNFKGEYCELIHMQRNGYEELDSTAIMAARAVDLDYAGVDLLFDSKSGRHVCLEINSGPLLTDEVSSYFSKLYKVKK